LYNIFFSPKPILAMPMFQIETYKVSTYLERFTSETRRTRVLELIGPVLYHGIQNRALFAFSNSFDGAFSSPVVGYLTAPGGYAGFSIAGWFPVAEFSYYYDIVRSERPVHVLYEFRDAGASSGYLRKLGLGTSVEQLGEGPTDSSERISAMMASNISGIRDFIVPMPTTKDLTVAANGQ
jgi:hypothetical protein